MEPASAPQQQRKLVGLCGYARAGKDTVAAHLVAKHGFKRVAFADALREFALMFNSPLGEGTRYNDLPIMGGAAEGHLRKLERHVNRLLNRIGKKPKFRDYAHQLASALNLVVIPKRGNNLTYARAIRELGYEGAKAKYPDHIRPHLVALGDCMREYVLDSIWIDACLPDSMELFTAMYGPNARIAVSDVRYDNERKRVATLFGKTWYIERTGVGAANPTEGASIPLVQYDSKLENTGTIEELNEKTDKLLLSIQ